MKILFFLLVIFIIKTSCFYRPNSVQDVKRENIVWPGCDFYEGFEEYKEGDSKICLWWPTDRKNFSDAEASCEARRARLAVFDSRQLFKILLRIYNQLKENIWVGLDDRQKEGTFVWHDGTVFQKENYTQYFAPGEPDIHGPNEDCVHIWKDKGLLNDNTCDHLFLYVCEMVKLEDKNRNV